MKNFIIIFALIILMVAIFKAEGEIHVRNKRGGAKCSAACAYKYGGFKTGSCEKKKGNKSSTCGDNYVCVCKGELPWPFNGK